MLSPANKGSRRSTRAGRYMRGSGSGGRTSRGSSGIHEEGAATSWRQASSDKEARKWIQVMRPPAPNARFFIPAWVPLDELTPEEKSKYGPQFEDEAAKGEGTTVKDTGDTAMTATDTKVVEQKPQAESETAVGSLTAAAESDTGGVSAMITAEAQGTPSAATITTVKASEVYRTTETEKATVDTQETKTLEQSSADTRSKAGAADALFGTATEMADAASHSAEGTTKSTPLSPLAIPSRETSEGIPPSIPDSKALASIEPLEEQRPHDPVADTLEEPGTVPPSRPISEPAAILMEGPALPLIGDSVVSPVPVSIPPTDSTVAASAPLAASNESDHFVHSESDITPFHQFTEVASNEENAVDEEAQPPTAAEANDDAEVSEPESKRPRLE